MTFDLSGHFKIPRNDKMIVDLLAKDGQGLYWPNLVGIGHS